MLGRKHVGADAEEIYPYFPIQLWGRSQMQIDGQAPKSIQQLHNIGTLALHSRDIQTSR